MPDQAADALARVHGTDLEGLVESVVLAITNFRWRKIARPLLQRLVADEVLDPGRADLLSFALLESDVVGVTVPGSWLVDFYVQMRDDEPRRLDPARTYSLERHLTPQTHRWAAACHAGSREGIARVLRRALRMDSRHGAAAIRGLVDGTERASTTTRPWSCSSSPPTGLRPTCGWPPSRASRPGPAQRRPRPGGHGPGRAGPPVGRDQPADPLLVPVGDEPQMLVTSPSSRPAMSRRARPRCWARPLPRFSSPSSADRLASSTIEWHDGCPLAWAIHRLQPRGCAHG
jgi:hypothetical protein